MPNEKSTRNANGAGSIRQRSDGRWEAIVTVGIDPGTGKPIKKSFYGKTQKEARQKMTKALSDIDKGTYKDPKRMTVGEWADIWLKDFSASVRPNTYNSYEGIVRNHIKPKLGRVPLAKLDSITLQRYLNGLMSEGFKDSTVALIRRITSMMLKKAVDLDLISKNPMLKCKSPTSTLSPDIHPINPSLLQEFVEKCQSSKYGMIFITSLFSGLREGQTLGLLWKNIDFENHTITVDHQVQWSRGKGHQWKICDTKTKASHRIVKVAPSLIAMLSEYRKTVADTSPDAFVFDDGGKPYHTNTLVDRFHEIADPLGLDNRIHDLRHSYATMSLENGDDLKTVSENLGHGSVSTTGNIYAHFTQKMREESANRMENRMKSIVGQNVGQSDNRNP